MNTERELIYHIDTDTEDLNEYNILKPYVYQRLFSQLADRHLIAINEDIGRLMKYNLAWALVSISVEIVRPIQGIAKLNATTWHSQRRGPYFRRDFIFRNENGETVFHGTSFSIVLDVETRTVYRKRELPLDIIEPIEEFTIDAAPNLRVNCQYGKVDERKVYGSYIDRLGHVNNCRYGEFGYDMLSDEERNKLSSLKRMDIFFSSELRDKDHFSILRADEDNKIFIRGYNETKSENSFDIIYHF
jgi:acyl-ACP thioesterase